MDHYINLINNNRIFNGCVSLYSTIFSKHFINELPENIDNIYDYFLLKYFLVFSFTFLSTRSIVDSFLLTLIFILLTKFILNQNSRFCISNKIKKKNNENENKEITIYDVIAAQKVIKKYNDKYLNI